MGSRGRHQYNCHLLNTLLFPKWDSQQSNDCHAILSLLFLNKNRALKCRKPCFRYDIWRWDENKCRAMNEFQGRQALLKHKTMVLIYRPAIIHVQTVCLSERAVVCFLALTPWLALCCNCQDNQTFVAVDRHYRHTLRHKNYSVSNLYN